MARVAGFSDEAKPIKTGNVGVVAVASDRRALNTYIAVLALTALALITLLAVYRLFSSPANYILGAVFVALIAVAEMYPIHVAPKTKVSVTAAAIFSVILLFDPLVAVIVAGAGVGVAQLFKKKKSLANRIFDSAQSVIFTAAAALVYGEMGSLHAAPALVSAYGIICAAVAAATLYMINSAAVSFAAGLRMRRNPAGIWLIGTKQAAVQETALLAIGLAGAMIVKEAPWGIVLLLAPVCVIYYSFKHMSALNARVESQMEELKATQAQLVESARMASIGVMVAGIAHQINNPMFVIRGRAETLIEDADEHLKTPSARNAVKVIFEMAERVSRIINSLIPNSQISEDGTAHSDINEVVRNTLVLLESKLLKSSVEVSTTLAEGLPPCLGDACEIQEMLINLVDNACNAMPKGGNLAISTRETDSGIYVRVSDTGAGIAPENLSRIFNPFFTTRKGSGGVGLGLYVSKHIAQKYGGSMSVDSKVGEGTTFNISLPGGDRKTSSAKRHDSLVASFR